MITKPEKPGLPDGKPTDPWAKAVYPEGHDVEKPGTFAEIEEMDIARGRTDPEHKVDPPEPPEPPEPGMDPNYLAMTDEQRLDALLQGWLRPDGTINYDSPLCPFKR